jgi:hypothetical protein
VAANQIQIVPVRTRSEKREFVELAYRLNVGDPAWVPPLRDEVYGLLNARKNPWFKHGRMQLFIARMAERTVGRISAHIDDLALAQPPEQGFGPGTGHWGLFEAESEDVARALFDAADDRA